MSVDSRSSQDDQLQFDSATPAAGLEGASKAGCARCKSPIRSCYYEVNGLLICARCKAALESKLGDAGPAGGGRMLRAFGFGAVAAVAGAALYLGVAFLLHIEFALIAILVGYMVGRAV